MNQWRKCLNMITVICLRLMMFLSRLRWNDLCSYVMQEWKSAYLHFMNSSESQDFIFLITWCYKRIKAEKGWSFNQFVEYASKYSAYWLELVNVSSSDLTQSLFSFFNISLFNIIFLSTSHSTCVTNTFSSSLTQSLNIT